MPVANDLLTNISETDKIIFHRLANRGKVDLSEFKVNNPAATPPRPRTRTPVRTPPASPQSFVHSPPKSPSRSLFAQAVKNSPKLAPPPPLPSSFHPENALHKILSGGAPPPPSPPPHSPSRPQSPPAPPRSPLQDGNEKRLKHALLLQLSKMKQMKVPLTRDFTMDDSIDDMQFEIDHQENNTAVINAVNMGKGIIGVGFTMLEMGNNKLGPFLNLAGLGQAACVNMDRYNSPLEKIYRKFFRKHSQSPIQELLVLIGGTIVMTHLGNKGGPMIKALLNMFLGGMSSKAASGPDTSPAPPASHAPPETAFTQRGYNPRNMPPPTFAGVPPAALPPTQQQQPPGAPPPSSGRKPLRRPGFSDRGAAPYVIPTQQPPAPAHAPPAPPPPPAPPAPTPARIPPPKRASQTHTPTVLVFPLAGTPVRGTIRRGDTETHMSLPTVIEEIVPDESKHDQGEDEEDLSSVGFERLMREVLKEDEEKKTQEGEDIDSSPAC